VGVPRPPRPPPPRRPRPRWPPWPYLPPLGLVGGAPRREAGGEVEGGGGVGTSAREVVEAEGEDVVGAGVWRPRVSFSRVRASQTCRKMGVGR
jgi:hypothetical protein